MEISQATFDEAVADNVATFGMSRAEAVADAVAQFEASGVALANLIVDAAPADARAAHPVLRALAAVRAWADGAEDTGGGAAAADVAAALATLGAECARLNENKMIARSSGAVAAISDAARRAGRIAGLVASTSAAGAVLAAAAGETTAAAAPQALKADEAESVLQAAFASLRLLCAGHDEARKTVQIDVAELALVCACASPRPDLAAAADAAAPGAGAGAGPAASPSPQPRLLPELLVRGGLLTCASLCVRREATKAQMFDGGLAQAVARHLRVSLALAGLVRDACVALARLLTDDDLSVLASNSYAFARTIAKGHDMPRLLMAALQRHNGDAAAAAEIYAALRSVIVNDEVCREVDALDGIAIIATTLAVHVAAPLVAPSASGGGATQLPVLFESGADDEDAASVGRASAAGGTLGGGCGGGGGEPTEIESVDGGGGGGDGGSVAASEMTAGRGGMGGRPGGGIGSETAVQRRVRMVRCGFAALRSLANSDPAKIKMGEGPVLGALLQALGTMIGAPSVLEQVVGVLSSICLRLPDNSQRVVDRGGLPLLARAMRTHMGHAPLQRAICLALRNMVVKDPGRLRAQAALDEGFEALLKQAYLRHVSARDVAYACLRDLGTDVETTIGQAQAARAARAIAAGSVYTD